MVLGILGLFILIELLVLVDWQLGRVGFACLFQFQRNFRTVNDLHEIWEVDGLFLSLLGSRFMSHI